MLKRILYLLAFALSATTFTFSQVTTSNITGVIKNPANEPLTGASIKVTHVPTGTVYSTITNKNGRYNINNVQPGGPYRFEVTFVGFGKETREDIFLNL